MTVTVFFIIRKIYLGITSDACDLYILKMYKYDHKTNYDLQMSEITFINVSNYNIIVLLICCNNNNAILL